MPPTGRFLLDTNIVIALLRGEAAVTTHLEMATQVFVPSVALGELYYGAHKSSRPEENIARVDNVAETAAVLSCETATAAVYGRLKAELRELGTPIPENDLWIAALAVQHDATLVTRDTHFDLLTNLPTVTWSTEPGMTP